MQIKYLKYVKLWVAIYHNKAVVIAHTRQQVFDEVFNLLRLKIIK